MTARPASHAVPKTANMQVNPQKRVSGTANRVPPDKTAGQRLCPASPSLKGVCGCLADPHHTPLRGSAA